MSTGGGGGRLLALQYCKVTVVCPVLKTGAFAYTLIAIV